MVLEGEAVQTVATWLPGPALTAVLKYSCFCWSFREKSSVEQEIKEKEESVRQRTNEVQVRGVCCWRVTRRYKIYKCICNFIFLYDTTYL